MKILALSGGIASGKSTVARMFEALGAVVIDADRAAHQVYRQGTSLYREIVKRYGKKILDKDLEIDRSRLAALLFENKREKQWLEAKIHPATRKYIGELIQKAILKHAPLILVEAALHVESGYYRSFQGLILVKAKTGQQIKRLMERNKLSPQQCQQRIRNQLSLREKLRHADWVIDNSENLERTQSQVQRLFRQLSLDAS